MTASGRLIVSLILLIPLFSQKRYALLLLSSEPVTAVFSITSLSDTNYKTAAEKRNVLPEGVYLISVSNENFISQSEIIELKAGARAEKFYRLSSQNFTLKLEFTPSPWQLYMDGKMLLESRGSTVRLDNIPGGRHSLFLLAGKNMFWTEIDSIGRSEIFLKGKLRDWRKLSAACAWTGLIPGVNALVYRPKSGTALHASTSVFFWTSAIIFSLTRFSSVRSDNALRNNISSWYAVSGMAVFSLLHSWISWNSCTQDHQKILKDAGLLSGLKTESIR